MSIIEEFVTKALNLYIGKVVASIDLDLSERSAENFPAVSSVTFTDGSKLVLEASCNDSIVHVNLKESTTAVPSERSQEELAR